MHKSLVKQEETLAGSVADYLVLAGFEASTRDLRPRDCDVRIVEAMLMPHMNGRAIDSTLEFAFWIQLYTSWNVKIFAEVITTFSK